MIPASEVIELLNLQPNDTEGGYFANTYPLPGTGEKPCSAIYYFLEQGNRSLMHKVSSDMLYHFYQGSPVEMLLLYPEGYEPRTEVCIFGNDLGAGQQPMKVIPGGTWLGSHIPGKGPWALMGVSMAPPFNPDDYFLGNRVQLIAEYPEQTKMIIELTNPVNGSKNS